MNNGISFEEACERTPEALTAQQVQNCPGQEPAAYPYVYIGIGGLIITAAAIIFLVVRAKSSKKPL